MEPLEQEALHACAPHTEPADQRLPWCIKATEANDNLQIRGSSCSSTTRQFASPSIAVAGCGCQMSHQRLRHSAGSALSRRTKRQRIRHTVALNLS
jgi:methionine synthase I (cobalamin-dependent)